MDDVIVRLRGSDYPVVNGMVASVGGRRVFLPIDRVAGLQDGKVKLTAAVLNLQSFERRNGEVLLKEDILGHRLIDVAHADLVKAWDIELTQTGEGWVLSSLDTRRPARLFGLIRQGSGQPREDWASFEPLVGHSESLTARGPFRRLRRLKPAQLADLLEDASKSEESEILGAVHNDPELEADVFEELDPDTATRLFGAKTDAEVANVLTHMRADDAADAVADLPQERRQEILNLLPAGTRAKLITLLGFNPGSAGGLMNVEFVTSPPDGTVAEALRRVRLATIEPQAQVTVHAISESGRLAGIVSVVELLHADPDSLLSDVIDADPVRVTPQTDVVDVALVLSDYNLMTVPVVDADNHLLGVVTVDDVLEATIPDDWRRREPPTRPEFAAEPPEPSPPTALPSPNRS